MEVITAWDLYWIFQLDELNQGLKFIVFLTIVMLIAACVAGILMRDVPYTLRSDYEGTPRWKQGVFLHKLALKLSIVPPILVLLVTLLPSTKTMLMVTTIPQVINNEGVQQLPEKMVKLLNSYLDEYTLGGVDK